MKANIGGDIFTEIKDSQKNFYVFEVVRIVNDPTKDLQEQKRRTIAIQTKIQADRFAANPRVANYVSAKLIHDPLLERRLDAERAEELRVTNEAIKKAEDEAIKKAKTAAKKPAKRKAKK